jgi:hypothetical protein
VTSATKVAVPTGCRKRCEFSVWISDYTSFVPDERITCTGLLRNIDVITFMTNVSHTVGFSEQSYKSDRLQ